MSKPIQLALQGAHDSAGGAPNIMDLLDQVRSLVGIFKGVEEALTGGTGGWIDWRVTAMSMDSPCAVEITPFLGTAPGKPDVNEPVREDLVDSVVTEVATGLHRLAEGDAKPTATFPYKAIACAEAVCNRLRKKLEGTTVDFSAYGEQPNFIARREDVDEFMGSIKSAKAIASRGVTELGSLEGYVTHVRVGAKGQCILQVRSRLDGTTVRCMFSKDALLGSFGTSTLIDLMNEMRVEVYGLIRYDAQGRIKDVLVDAIDLLDTVESPASGDGIFPPNFTGDLNAVEYLAEVRKEFDSDE